ncbi:MAG: D-TA family PLP-dependent enzyme [Chitinophagaceae bacterium]|nr:D-TA family PLP-dependent enzyme [Chitinophagaceae bacterium]
MAETNWFHISNANEIDSPALLVYPDRVKANIQTAIKMIGDLNRLRPHVKTHKCAQVVQLMIDAGIYKFKCATIAEAEMLGIQKATDVLLAYQPVGPKLHRFIALINKYPATIFSCLTDNMVAAAAQSKAFTEAGLQVPVYIDLNIGMNRTGINPGDEALELYKYCSTAAGIIIKGLHAYDGHIRDIDFEVKKKNCDGAFALVELLVNKIEAARLPKPIIIAGGSPAFSVHCKRESIECSPGTFIYWDQGYSVLCPEQDFIPAAVLLTRVVSLPGEEKICTDLGHKSVASENEISKRVFFPEFECLHVISQSEEHLVLENKSETKFTPGDILYGIPWHICPTVALYDSIKIIENGQYCADWKNIARDRKITI